MPIGLVSSCRDTVSPRTSTLDSTLAFVCDTHVWCMCMARMRVALTLARLCMQGTTRVHIEMKCEEKNSSFQFYCCCEFARNRCIRL